MPAGSEAGAAREINFTAQQLQRKYPKHAGDFGITGNYNLENTARIGQPLKDFVQYAPNQVAGTYRRTMAANFYVDPQSRLLVLTKPS